MRRSVSNPRVVLGYVFAVMCLLFICLLLLTWVYAEPPRVEVGFGAVGGTVHIRQSEFRDANLGSTVFRDELKRRLESTKFMEALRAGDSRRQVLFVEGTPVFVHTTPPPELDANPLAAVLPGAVRDGFQEQALVLLLCKVDRFDLEDSGGGLSVIYLFPRAFRVVQPANSWIVWLQTRLPGMPDTTKLTAESELANEAVKRDIEKQVRLVVEDCVSSLGN